MRRVVVLCPEKAGPYLARAMEHARAHGDAPIAGSDDCYPWLPVAHLLAVYVDQGISTPMTDLIACARAIGLEVEHRVLHADAWAELIRRTASRTRRTPNARRRPAPHDVRRFL